MSVRERWAGKVLSHIQLVYKRLMIRISEVHDLEKRIQLGSFSFHIRSMSVFDSPRRMDRAFLIYWTVSGFVKSFSSYGFKLCSPYILERVSNGSVGCSVSSRVGSAVRGISKMHVESSYYYQIGQYALEKMCSPGYAPRKRRLR